MRSRTKIKRATGWYPKYLGEGLYGLALNAAPRLTRADFGEGLRKYLRERNSAIEPERALVDRLFKMTYHCLQLREALPKFRKEVASEDWRRRTKVIRSLMKDLTSTERNFRKYRAVRRQPLTAKLVRAITHRMATVAKFLKEELENASKLIDNDRKVISGYLRPELGSQYMLDVDNHLVLSLPRLKLEERLLIIAGCAVVSGIIPSATDEQDVQARISMRIRRARQAYRRDSLKWGWEETIDVV